MIDGYRVSSSVQGEWDASSIPRGVCGVRLFNEHISLCRCPVLIVTMYVFCTLAHSRKVRGITSVFSMDNDFRSVSSDVGCRVRLVNVFFPSLRQNWTGSRTAEVSTTVGHEVDPLWVRIF